MPRDGTLEGRDPMTYFRRALAGCPRVSEKEKGELGAVPSAGGEGGNASSASRGSKRFRRKTVDSVRHLRACADGQCYLSFTENKKVRQGSGTLQFTTKKGCQTGRRYAACRGRYGNCRSPFKERQMDRSAKGRWGASCCPELG